MVAAEQFPHQKHWHHPLHAGQDHQQLLLSKEVAPASWTIQLPDQYWLPWCMISEDNMAAIVLCSLGSTVNWSVQWHYSSWVPLWLKWYWVLYASVLYYCLFASWHNTIFYVHDMLSSTQFQHPFIDVNSTVRSQYLCLPTWWVLSVDCLDCTPLQSIIPFLLCACIVLMFACCNTDQ